jgi:hypothetical protein
MERVFLTRCAREIPRPERQAMIERGAAVTVKRLAGAAGAQPLERVLPGPAGAERDLLLMRRIDELHLEAISFQRSFFTLLNRTCVAVANTTAATVKRPSAAH